MRRMIGAILTMLLVVPAGVRAQTSSIRPEIYEPIGHAAASPLREATNREAARFAKALRPRSMQQAPRRRNWVARHPVLLGTLVGAGIGLGFVAAEGRNSSDYSCPALLAIFGGTGAGIGAAAGVVIAIVLR